MSRRILGWPLLVLAAGGVVCRLMRSRRPPELILFAFAVPYCLLVAAWAMKSDRYLIPVLPVALVFSAAALDGLLGLPVLAERKRRIEALFYSNLGANYPALRFYEEANACYEFAFEYGMAGTFWFSGIVIGKTRALMALGRAGEADGFLRGALDRAPIPELRKRVEGLIRSIGWRSYGGER